MCAQHVRAHKDLWRMLGGRRPACGASDGLRRRCSPEARRGARLVSAHPKSRARPRERKGVTLAGRDPDAGAAVEPVRACCRCASALKQQLISVGSSNTRSACSQPPQTFQELQRRARTPQATSPAPWQSLRRASNCMFESHAVHAACFCTLHDTVHDASHGALCGVRKRNQRHVTSAAAWTAPVHAWQHDST